MSPVQYAFSTPSDFIDSLNARTDAIEWMNTMADMGYRAWLF